MKHDYDIRDIVRLTGVTEGQIRYWDKVGLIAHCRRHRGRLRFDFKALVAFRTVKALLDQGVSTRKVRRCIESLRRQLPEIDEPLAELRIDVLGRRLVVGRNRRLFTPGGQLLLQFEGPPERKPSATAPFEDVESLFFQALELEDQGQDERAGECYRTLLARKPDHVDSLVNLGNIEYRSGRSKQAEVRYRRALGFQPDHVEGNYNLANLLDEQGDDAGAMRHYRNALAGDPEFADAHFNLARVLERMGAFEQARRHWRSYLALDTTGQWVDYIRRKLDEPTPEP